VRPIKDSNLGADADLADIPATPIGNGTVTSGDAGILVSGSSNTEQNAIFIPLSGSGGSYPALVKLHTTPGSAQYVVDVYANGYGSVVTALNVQATLIDQNSYDIPVGNQVSVFERAGLYYITSTLLFQTSTQPLLTPIRISGQVSADNYKFYKTTTAAPTAPDTGGEMTNAYEMNASTAVPSGFRTCAYYEPTLDQYFFSMPYGSCS
jgi:hypothetical protein